MALVGDILVRCRENGPDPGSFLGKPNTPTLTAVLGGTYPAGTYYIVLTALNQWGESLPCAEQALVLGGGNGTIQVTPGILPRGTVAYRVYIADPNLSQGPGGEAAYFQSPASVFVAASTNPATLLAGVPPTRATAMLPDTDGGFVSSFTLYRWLNNAIQKASKIAGGIPLVTGVQAFAGQGMYRIQGKWIHFSAGWFDGWPISFGRKSDVFIRQSMTGIPGLTTMEQGEDTTVFQMWPQPNRTGSSAFVQSGIGGQINATQTTCPVNDNSGFLGLGLIQIEDELISYYGTSSNTFANLLRGVGGTVPAAHINGTPVIELNIRLSGFRLPVDYAPGDSTKTLPIPPAWEEPLVDYVTAQFKKSELDNQAALAIEKAFEESISAVSKASRPRTGPSQIGSATREVYPGGYGGGILLP